MKSLILTIVLSLFILNAYSQNAREPIDIVKKNRYYQNELKLSGKQLQAILSTNPASAAEYKAWKRQTNIGLPLVYGGLGIVLVGSYVGGLDVMLIGLGVEVVGAIIVIPARKHLHSAVSLHNSSLNEMGMKPPVSFGLMVNSTGLGVRMTF